MRVSYSHSFQEIDLCFHGILCQSEKISNTYNCRKIFHFPKIHLISHIAEMQGEFANTLVIESCVDNASRVREAE
jgi:hypothetical protein